MALTCSGLTTNSGHPPPATSSTLKTGFQYTPVASIATAVTPAMASQAASCSRSAVIVPNCRTSSTASPVTGSERSTQATTVFVCTSNPAQQAWTTFIRTPPP